MEKERLKKEFMATILLVLILGGVLNVSFITPQAFAEVIQTPHLLEENGQKDLSDEPLNEEKEFIDRSENTLTKDSQNNENVSSYEMPIYGGNNQDSNETFHWFNFTYKEGNKTRVVVGLNGDETASLTKLEKIVADYHARIVNNVSMGGIVRAVVVELSFASVDSFVKEVRSSGLASYIEPNVKIQVCFTPNDPYWSYQWGPRIIEADYAWDTTIGDPSVLVAIIDTGIDWNHPDLVANYVPLGYDWVNDDNDPMDDHGHGTHCAGIIAATINNSLGIAGLAQVRIMAEKAFNSGGWGTDDDIANAIAHAVDQGADILSNSWGSDYPSTLIYEAIQYAYNHGVLVIAAAGNLATSQKHYPAAYDEVIAVTATDSYDNPASFTNFGEWVELAAPGVDIYSTVWDDSYTYMSGTSMATPHVAGVAALILSQYPNMTRDQLRIQLRYTADDLGSPGFDDYYGYGRINAQKAVEQSPPDHDLLILHWKKPKFVVPGTLAVVNTTVFNFGTSDEENITVQLLANGSLVDSDTIDFLGTGMPKTVNFTWTPTIEGIYNLTSYILPVPNETITTNNLATAMVRVGYFKTILFDQTHATDSIFSYSVWIAALNETGYIVDVHNAGPIEPAVLIGYDALVIPQAHDYYTSDELAAIQEFVSAGGGLFVIGDDEPDIYTQLTGFAGITWSWEWGCGGYTSDITPHPVTEGVETAYFSSPLSNLYVSGQAQSLIRDYCGYVMLAASEAGAGKVVAIADEDSINDGYIGYADNLQLAINVIEWITIRPEHDLAVLLDTPTYIEPGEPSLLNLTLHNRGISNESNVKLFLLINDSIVDEVTIPELVGGSSHKLSYLWIPTVEAIYNVTGYVLPVQNETTIENNFAHAYVFVGYPVKAFVLHSAGNYYSNIIVNWETLNTKWYMFGDQLIYIDYTTLNIDDITYEDIAATEADVLIISCAADPYMGWEFTDAEIEAISRYVMEGHGLIATAGTFYYSVPNNNKLAPLFGLNESIMWSATQTDLLYLLNTTHPLFDNVPNPLVFPQVGTATPYDGQWDLNELINGEYLALGYYRESAVVVRRGLVYISPMLEWIPPHYHHHLQLLYNSITWSRYQKPKHELTVSLEALEYLELGESVLLNATVCNGGLSNETNVELQLLINGSIATSILIPELPTGESHTINYTWTPTTEALYNITVYAPPVPNEDDETNNIVTKMIRVRSIIGLVVFEEAHLPAYSIGSNPAAYGTGGYSEFANYLMVNGYIVSTINPGTIINSSGLASADVLVIVAPQNSYLESELDAIENWVKEGGNLLLISDWGSFGSVARTIASRFNIVLRGDAICDSDENVGDPSQVYYDGANLLVHPVTKGVDRVEIYAGDGILTAPAEEIPLIVTDYDGTAFWFSDNSPALGVSVMSAFEGGAIGSGRLIIMTDSNVWDSINDADYDGDVGFYDSDNEVLAINSINWLSIRYEHDIAARVEAPEYLEPNDSSLLNATVFNVGLNNETSVELQLLINNSLVDSVVIPVLLTESSYTLSYLWVPTVEALYNVTAYVSPVPGENFTANNVATKMVDVRPVKGYVLFDQAHSTDSIMDYSIWITNLTYRGYIVDILTISPISLPLLKDYDVFVIPQAHDNYTPSELSAIQDFVLNGGGLLVIGDDEPSIYTDLTGFAGIDWVSGGVGGVTDDITPHDVTSGVYSVYLDAPIAKMLVTVPALDLVRDPAGGIMLAISEQVGRVIGFADEGSLWDGGITQEDNLLLANNMIDWLIGVKYEHELIVSIEAPTFLEPSESVLLNATVYNKGLNNETNVDLFILINGTELSSAVIPELPVDSSYTLSYLWTPVTEGTYNITAYAPPVPSENITANNVNSRYVIVSRAVKILAYVQYTDYDQEYANALMAIESTFGPNYLLAELWDYTELDSVLPGNDILFIPEQENADLYMMESIGATWSTTLSNFINEGGIIILCDHTWGNGGTYGILTGAGLMSISGSNPITGSTVYLVDPSDPLAKGVSNTFIAPNGALSFITAETNVVFNDGTYPVVIHKTIGPGHIALIGFDYFASNPDADQILGNAVGLRIRYEHDIAVSLEAPTFLELGDSALLNATVYNRGLSNETDVELQLLINGTTVESILIPNFLTGSSYTLSYSWTPMIEGIYNITAYSPPVENETNVQNNMATKLVLVIEAPELPTDRPAVYVDPLITIVQPGSTFLISVKIFNLTDAEFLGNLYGFDIEISWDPYVLQYINHTVTVPVEDYPEGVLHEPFLEIKNVVNTTQGFAWFAYVSMSPAEPFNNPGYSSVVFYMTFTAIASGESPLNFVNVDLSDDNGDPIIFASLDGLVVVGESPQVRDVAILNVTSFPAAVYPGRLVNITVVASNEGEAPEMFNVTVYANTTVIGTQEVSHIAPGENVTLVFVWNTTGLSPCNNFTIWAEATTVPNEVNVDNNIFTDGYVKIKMLGDLNGDDVIDILDIVLATSCYGSTPGDPNWNPEADLARPWNVIEICDIVTIASRYGRTP